MSLSVDREEKDDSASQIWSRGPHISCQIPFHAISVALSGKPLRWRIEGNDIGSVSFNSGYEAASSGLNAWEINEIFLSIDATREGLSYQVMTRIAQPYLDTFDFGVANGDYSNKVIKIGIAVAFESIAKFAFLGPPHRYQFEHFRKLIKENFGVVLPPPERDHLDG